MRSIVGLLVVSMAMAIPSGANAHAQLDHAIPPVGSTLTNPPPEVRIFFTQSLDPQKSGIEVIATDGRSVTVDPAIVEHDDPRLMVLKLPPLPEGTYRVNWHTLSTDGGDHALSGHYKFEIKH